MSHLVLSEGLERINTTDLLPLQEMSMELYSIPSEMNFQDMNGSQQLYQMPTHHQLSHQSSVSMINMDHLTSTPCLDDFDTEYKFEVEIPVEEKAAKALWYYDAVPKRLFVKGDQSLSAFISCKFMNTPLYVRLMPVYTTRADIRKPVNRCPNHKNNCKSAHPDHIVHCHNEGAEYKGTENGEVFGERLSVLIPLKKSLVPRDYHDEIKEEIVFSFTCLNSCSGISRRPTALIFTLEDKDMQILGRTVMNFRSCTSPKRDFESDRKKRGIMDDCPGHSSAKRPMIVKNSDGTTHTLVKQETDSDDAVPSSPSGEHLLTLVLPDTQTGLKVLHYVQDLMSGDVTRGKPVNKKYFKQISKQIDEATKELKEK